VEAHGARGRTGVLVKPRAAISWSGGKDCCTALLRTYRDYDVVAMITMFARTAREADSHGLRPEVLSAHAQRLGLPPPDRTLFVAVLYHRIHPPPVRSIGDGNYAHPSSETSWATRTERGTKACVRCHGLTAVLPALG
jgi:hypothetical protein